MRPMEDEGEHYLAYYLMKEDQDASRFKQARLESGIDALVPEDEVCGIKILPTVILSLAEHGIFSYRLQTSTLYAITRLSRSNKMCPTSSCCCLTMATSKSTCHHLCHTIFLYQRQTSLLIEMRHGSWRERGSGNDRGNLGARACITKVSRGRCF